MNQVTISVAAYDELMVSHNLVKGLENGTAKVYKPIPVFTKFNGSNVFLVSSEEEMHCLQDIMHIDLVTECSKKAEYNKQLREQIFELSRPDKSIDYYQILSAVLMCLCVVLVYI